MPKEASPVEVQITLATGKVLDFQTGLGDKITLNKVSTVRDVPMQATCLYYTLVITPKGEDDGS